MMRIFLVLTLLAALAVLPSASCKTGHKARQTSPDEIRWLDFEAAVKKQKKKPKIIFADIYTPWCGPCKMLERNTFSNPKLARYVNEHFYPVRFNGESPDPVHFRGQEFTNPDYQPGKRGRNGVHQLTRFLNVSAYPTMVFIDANGDLITQVRGYRTPQDLELYLKVIASGDYKNIKDQAQWEAYKKNFKPEF